MDQLTTTYGIQMNSIDLPVKRGRGRPPKSSRQFSDTRAELIKSGLELLTENGFISSGIDTIVKNVSVPKGSFLLLLQKQRRFWLCGALCLWRLFCS